MCILAIVFNTMDLTAFHYLHSVAHALSNQSTPGSGVCAPSNPDALDGGASALAIWLLPIAAHPPLATMAFHANIEMVPMHAEVKPELLLESIPQ